MEVSTEDLLSWYQQLAVIRGTEKAAHDLFLAGLVNGTTHLAAGQEAVAVGAGAALRDDDTLEAEVIPTVDKVADAVRRLAAY